MFAESSITSRSEKSGRSVSMLNVSSSVAVESVEESIVFGGVLTHTP